MGDSMKFDEFAGWSRINGSGWELVASMDMKSNSESIRWSSWGQHSRHKRRVRALSAQRSNETQLYAAPRSRVRPCGR